LSDGGRCPIKIYMGGWASSAYTSLPFLESRRERDPAARDVGGVRLCREGKGPQSLAGGMSYGKDWQPSIEFIGHLKAVH